MMNDFSPWSEKHRPRKTEEVAGQGPAVEKVVDYVKNFDKKKKPLLLYGTPGIGKTCIIQAVSNEFDLELVE
ncbi:MAG: AAA family ATPase, partial [Halospina sp.]